MVRKGSTSTVEKRKNIRLNNLKNPKQPNVSAENLDFLLDQSKYTLDLVNTWINGADTKVSVSCGIFSVIIAAIVFAAENILGNIGKCCCVFIVSYYTPHNSNYVSMHHYFPFLGNKTELFCGEDRPKEATL